MQLCRKNRQQAFLPHALALILLLNVFGAGRVNAASEEPRQPATLDAQTRTEVIEAALKALNDSYVFPEVAQKMDAAIRARVQRKEYDAITDAGEFARALTAHLQEVSHDKHLRVVPTAGSRFGLDQQQQRVQAVKRNFGFEKVERLSGNVGYLDLRGFEQGPEANETATAAMNFLANTDALIVDLRQNGGGSPMMVAWLSSYLFDKRTHLNSIYNRPSNSTREFFTEDTVPGKRYGNNTNTRFVDSYSTVDAMASYRVNRHLDLRLNVSNLNNAYYFERLGGGHLIPGASRYALVTTSFHF